ncbi:MAG: ATP-binding protein, partial [Proteocatella sp.]
HVSIILHGHKHTSISRPLTNNKFYIDPKRMIHVFSAGSIGSDRGSRSYQVVEVHSSNDTIDVQATKYIYEGIEFQNAETITFPPKETNLIATFNIIDILKSRNYDLHEQYIRVVSLKDKKSEQYKVNEVINDISNTITTFKDIRSYLERHPDVVFILLLSIHYRILVQDGVTQNKKMLEQIKKTLKSISNIEEDYANEIFDLQQTIKGSFYLKKYKAIQEKLEYHKYKKETAYIVTTTHLLDLYLSLGYYGEVYFKREGLQSKVNFKLEDEIFNENLPTPFLKITGEEDRRTATVAFKCLNPTVHKTAVLIVKDFEEKISKIEDSFKEIGLKIYYIRPKVNPDGYELENYSFEAYIPKLLPLLTGEHLYKQKEVFIRELIQNSLDAILLRTKLDTTEFNKDILITIGQVEKDGKPVKYLKIRDSGVGMDQYKIERYFTSIGRSFYTSDDYIELLQEKKINFKAVSNFGIGFLSVFMVCNAVKVMTNSYDKEKKGIEMEIPNYEGCFFVKKDEKNETIGTEITLYEGDKKRINHKNIIKYLEDNILNIDLNISLENKIDDQRLFIEKNRLLKELFKKEKDFLFIPIDNEGLIAVSYDEMIKNIKEYKYGILINLNGNGKSILMNSGIRVTARIKGLKIGIDDNYFDSDSPFDLYYFFPSSFIQLDVSRERILSFRSKDSDSTIHKTASTIFNNQARDFINLLIHEKRDVKLSIINNISSLLGNKGKNPLIEKEMLWISLFLNKDNEVELSFIPEKECIDSNRFYTCHGEVKNKQIIIDIAAKFIKDVPNKVINQKKKSKDIVAQSVRELESIEASIFTHVNKTIFTNFINISYHQKKLFSANTEEEMIAIMNPSLSALLEYTQLFSSKENINSVKSDDVSERMFDDFYLRCCSIVSFRDIGKVFLLQSKKKKED